MNVHEMLAAIGQDIRDWSTFALAIAAVGIAVWVSGWNIRGYLEKELKRTKEEMQNDMDKLSAGFQRSLEHRAAADMARWEKLEQRYERLFEALFDSRRKP